jgi:SAM-dependent methyltransferase
VSEPKTLNLGCGNRKIRQDEVGLDISEPCDVKHDLNVHPLPFKDEEFDEIYAYHVLEHIGSQGDWEFFFSEFSEYWRILKPGGILTGMVPLRRSLWAWGDPGHKRIIEPTWLQYLDQNEYKAQVGNTGMADYRSVWKYDFEKIFTKIVDDNYMKFALQKRG